ncbi:MAG TPA: dephospho-CoA kinase [Bacteroidales bacterium]|nr:dephospho-CoA kinase [Bacteroidales bacterium]
MNKHQSSPLKLGITGGIGSGKSTICKIFSVLGIPSFSADTAASEIMESDSEIKSKLNTLTGTDLYIEGFMNRKELAGIIFNDPSVLGKVNALVHPAVFRKFESWALDQNSPYVIMEAAILIESGAASLVDRVATVVAPMEERIARVMRRSSMSKEQIQERMRNQIDDNERIKQSDYIIMNSENDMIIPAILEIHKDILNNLNRRM